MTTLTVPPRWRPGRPGPISLYAREASASEQAQAVGRDEQRGAHVGEHRQPEADETERGEHQEERLDDEREDDVLPDDACGPPCQADVVRHGGEVVAHEGDVGGLQGGVGAALETADIALMGDDLSAVPDNIRLARRTTRVIWQNIVFSLVVKALFLVLAPLGLVSLWLAVFADMGTSLLVTANGLRLFRR